MSSRSEVSNIEVNCKMCGSSFTPDDAKPCASAYHDLRCPSCGSTNLDTSEILELWADYSYGKNNCLVMT